MTRKWDYYAVSAAQAVDLVESPDHRVWTAGWTPGLPEAAGEPEALFVVVATTGPGPEGSELLGGGVFADDKDPFPPPPPPPPGFALMTDFADDTARLLADAAPRSLDEDAAA